jgi:diaminopimelate decarboxylase
VTIRLRSVTVWRGPRVENATVVGYLCIPLDVLAQNTLLPETHVGDLVVLFQAGAHGLTPSPNAFLSHPAPVEVLL